MEGQTLAQVDQAVAKRCGTPAGGPNCLVIKEVPAKAPAALRDACRVGPPQYSTEPVNVGETRQVPPGTVVTLKVTCVPVLAVVPGTTLLSDVDTQVFERCGSNPDCLRLVVKPAVPDAARPRCTVSSLSYAPPPVVTQAWGSVLDAGTVATAQVSCGP